jgi:hypothetical protein
VKYRRNLEARSCNLEEDVDWFYINFTKPVYEFLHSFLFWFNHHSEKNEESGTERVYEALDGALCILSLFLLLQVVVVIRTHI